MDDRQVRLSELLAHVERGEDVVIMRDNQPVARIVSIESKASGPRTLGRDRGLFKVPDDFDQTDPEIETMFHGEHPD